MYTVYYHCFCAFEVASVQSSILGFHLMETSCSLTPNTSHSMTSNTPEKTAPVPPSYQTFRAKMAGSGHESAVTK